jgi:hypothetical protein
MAAPFATHNNQNFRMFWAMFYLPKNLIPWQDSNPGLLFLRRMQCPLLHAAMAEALF